MGQEQREKMSDLSGLVAAIHRNINSVVLGKNDSIILALATFLSGGHLLIEDAPGLGKTLLAKAFSRTFDLNYKRAQCTPDLLPSDITGASIYNPKEGEFRFLPGPVFANILLADEINRATPRAQSALLECMAEAQVTVDGITHTLEQPFMVIATQNPVEFTGTHPLPEAQLDRFFMRISMGYPDEACEIEMMRSHQFSEPIQQLRSIASREQIMQLKTAVQKVAIDDKVMRYIASIVRATREYDGVELGASPRGSMSLMKASQATALLTGQNFVTPQMVKRMAIPVLAHRLVLAHRSRLGGSSSESVIQSVLNQVETPVGVK
jgi:MoxR-like ATPase